MPLSIEQKIVRALETKTPVDEKGVRGWVFLKGIDPEQLAEMGLGRRLAPRYEFQVFSRMCFGRYVETVTDADVADWHRQALAYDAKVAKASERELSRRAATDELANAQGDLLAAMREEIRNLRKALGEAGAAAKQASEAVLPASVPTPALTPAEKRNPNAGKRNARTTSRVDYRAAIAAKERFEAAEAQAVADAAAAAAGASGEGAWDEEAAPLGPVVPWADLEEGDS